MRIFRANVLSDLHRTIQEIAEEGFEIDNENFWGTCKTREQSVVESSKYLRLVSTTGVWPWNERRLRRLSIEMIFDQLLSIKEREFKPVCGHRCCNTSTFSRGSIKRRITYWKQKLRGHCLNCPRLEVPLDVFAENELPLYRPLDEPECDEFLLTIKGCDHNTFHPPTEWWDAPKETIRADHTRLITKSDGEVLYIRDDNKEDY